MTENQSTPKPEKNQLIRFHESTIGMEQIRTVSSRELHFFLGVKTSYNDWITRRIAEYNFEPDIDFTSFLSESTGGRPAKEIYVSIDMAKELSMVERNKKGKEARKYFIRCEQELKSCQPHLPQNFSEALQLAADQAKQLELQAPKVKFAEQIECSDTTLSMGDFAKVNGNFGRNTLFALMRDNKILMKSNVPYQKHIMAGYFEVTETPTGAGIKTVTRITGKGQVWLNTKITGWLDNER